MKNLSKSRGRKFYKKFVQVFSLTALVLNMSFMGVFFVVPDASANGGAIWTTTGSCGTPHNVNHYSIGDAVYLNFSGFVSNTNFDWEIKGLPSSADPNTVVASGSEDSTDDGIGCFFAYTILSDDNGVYKAKYNDKTDNYSVEGESCVDEDNDLVCDDYDNCVGVYNPEQTDDDQDGVGDACDDCIDVDGDGYGDPASGDCCHSELDCNDNDPGIHPGAIEICGDDIDQNCDGLDLLCEPAPTTCGDGIVQWPNDDDFYEECEVDNDCDEGQYCDGCVCTQDDPEIVIIKAHKIVCESEDLLPNWDHDGDITSTTAEVYVAATEGCDWVEDEWNFEWGERELSYSGDSTLLASEEENDWYIFDPASTGSNPAEAEITLTEGLGDDSGVIWFREVLQEGYKPFSVPPGDLPGSDVSAEFYCDIDVEHYDNMEEMTVADLVPDEIYYCVAFNVPEPEETATGTIIIKKVSEDTSDQLFDFTGGLGEFSLEIGATTTFEMSVGNYEVFETATSGWSLLNVYCTDDSPGTSTNGVSIGLEAGEIVTCTFVNEKDEDPTPRTTISGCKYNNTIGDGNKDGGKLPGWEIELLTCPYLCSDSPMYQTALTAGECNVQATTVTGNDGCYEFEVDGNSCYRIQEKMSQDQINEGWQQTYPANLEYYFFYVAEGEAAENIDFANYRPSYCGDGTCDSDESCSDCEQDCGSCGGGTLFPTNRGGGTTGQTSSPSTPIVLGEEGAPVLVISKTADQEFVNIGDQVEYIITVTNNGNLTAFEVNLEDLLPEGLEFIDDESASKTWDLGDISPGVSKSATVIVKVTGDITIGKITNTATAAAANHPIVEDSADVEVREIMVLAETGFDLKELMLIIGSIITLMAIALGLKRRLQAQNQKNSPRRRFIHSTNISQI